MKADWARIEQEYVSSGISQRELAGKNGISEKALAKHCRAGNWVQKRKRYQAECTAKVLQKSGDDFACRYHDLSEKVWQALCILLDRTVIDARESDSLNSSRIVALNLKTLVDILGSAMLLPLRQQEAEARIRKIQAEIKRLESDPEECREVQIRFVNGDWME